MNVESYLAKNGVKYEKHAHTTAYTAQGLAHAEHVSGHIVAKPVIVKGKAGFYMCVLPAPRHVDLAKVADVVHEQQLQLASEAEMAQLFPDCELGAEPPFGNMFGLKTIMDNHLQEDAMLVMQAGTHTDAIKMRRSDWQRVCAPVVASISTE